MDYRKTNSRAGKTKDNLNRGHVYGDKGTWGMRLIELCYVHIWVRHNEYNESHYYYKYKKPIKKMSNSSNTRKFHMDDARDS